MQLQRSILGQDLYVDVFPKALVVPFSPFSFIIHMLTTMFPCLVARSLSILLILPQLNSTHFIIASTSSFILQDPSLSLSYIYFFKTTLPYNPKSMHRLFKFLQQHHADGLGHFVTNHTLPNPLKN